MDQSTSTYLLGLLQQIANVATLVPSRINSWGQGSNQQFSSYFLTNFRLKLFTCSVQSNVESREKFASWRNRQNLRWTLFISQTPLGMKRRHLSTIITTIVNHCRLRPNSQACPTLPIPHFTTNSFGVEAFPPWLWWECEGIRCHSSL